MRIRPAVLLEEEVGLPHSTPPAFKWTGNANTATVGERTGSGVQATDSAGGRLMVGGALGEVGGWGVSRDGRTVQTSCLITQTPSSLL